jgi:hypothetical protein
MNARFETTVGGIDTTTAGEELRRNCAAVRLHVKSFGTTRTLSQGQVAELMDGGNTDTTMLRASKKLLDANHPTVKLLGRIRSQILATWRGMTLPYTEPGVRLMPRNLIPEFEQRMGFLRDELTAAVAELEGVWPSLLNAAQERLGDLFDRKDYPETLDNLFSVVWSYPEVSPPTYLMAIDPGLYRREQQRISERFDQAVQLAEQAVTEEFASMVAHLSERLSDDASGERKVFRDSAVENLREFFGRFRQLPIHGGSAEQLENLINQVQGVLGGVSPRNLRDSSSLRQNVAQNLSRVGAELEGMLVSRPRRKIVRMGGLSE